MSDIFPFPVLSKNRIDYKDPGAYSAKLNCVGNTSVTVDHSLKTNNLVAHFIEQQEAHFFSTVSLGRTIYRKTVRMPTDALETNSESATIVGKQQIELPALLDSPEIHVNSGVVMSVDKQVPVQAESGLNDFFRVGEELFFPQHSLIAQNGWQLFFSMQALFSIQSDDEIRKPGSFKCAIAKSRFKIEITMSRKLYDIVESSVDSPARAQVICTALTLALAEINAAYSRTLEAGTADDADLQLLEQAEGLKSYLEKEEIPTWEDSNFDPAYAASLHKPAIL